MCREVNFSLPASILMLMLPAVFVAGATDIAATPTNHPKLPDLASGRNWWSFQPLSNANTPEVHRTAWVRRRIDVFVLNELENKRLAPSSQADPRTLIVRAYQDLTGLRPTFEQAGRDFRLTDVYGEVVRDLLA